MAARLATLRDDYVDTSFGRLDGLRDRGDLRHHLRAGLLAKPVTKIGFDASPSALTKGGTLFSLGAG
jgi:hypothetical protein